MSTEHICRGSQRDSNECKVCKKGYSDLKKLIQCGRCEHNFCVACTDMTQVKLSLLKDPSTGVMWFCCDCQQGALKSIKTHKEIEERCKEYWEAMEQQITKIEQKLETKADKSELGQISATVANIKVNMGNKVSGEKLKKLQTDIEKLQLEKDKISKDIQATVQKEVTEWREIDRRRSNIMIYEIPEGNAADKKTDKNRIEEVVFDQLGICDVKISKAYRVGRKRLEQQQDEAASTCTPRPRPIKLVCASQDDKAKITSSYWAKKKDNEALDFTRYETERYQKLKDELKTKEENGEIDWCIRKLKLVKKNKK